MNIDKNIKGVAPVFIGKGVLGTAKVINDVVRKIKKRDVMMADFVLCINRGGLKDEND